MGNAQLSHQKKKKTVSKTLIDGAHEVITCAPKFSVFGTFGAHDQCSCAFIDFEISDFGLFFFS